MNEEFNLSERIDDKLMTCEQCGKYYCTLEETYFKLEDVKEFIKLERNMCQCVHCKRLNIKKDKLAGDKLIEGK